MALFGKKAEPWNVNYEDAVKIFYKVKKNEIMIVKFEGDSEIQINKKVDQLIYKLINLEQVGAIATAPDGSATVTLKKTAN